MSGFNGSGTFNISGVGLPYVSGTTISSSVANQLNIDLANGLTNCITKDGQQSIQANIPFNNYKITQLGAATAATDAASVLNIQNATGTFLSVTGTNTIVATATPAITGYVAGMTFRFVAAGTNVGPVTINISGLGAKAITKEDSQPLEDGDINSGYLVSVTYDGTNFVLQSGIGGGSGLIEQETQTATSGQTVFTLAGITYTPGANNLCVFVDGVKQYVGSSYTETSNTAITFSSGLHLGASVQFIVFSTVEINTMSAASVTYTPSGTGAVTTNVQTKLRESVSVNDFGASPSASASTNRLAFQNAIDYAKANGIGKVIVPSGNYSIDDSLYIRGDFGNAGFEFQGFNSTLTFTANAVALYIDSSNPTPAPELRIRALVHGFYFHGPYNTGAGIGNTAAVGIQCQNGAAMEVRDCQISNFYRGLYGYGCLISRFENLAISYNYYGIQFQSTATFAPNDVHFHKCYIWSNKKAVSCINFPNGAITFISCEIEGNNLSGNTTDGVRVVEFFNAGKVTLLGCHLEQNPGEYNIYYDGGSLSTSLSVIGCEIIPGDSCGNVLYVGNATSTGSLFVEGSRVTNNVGTNQIVLATGVPATIIGNTAGYISGDLSKTVVIRDGTVNVARQGNIPNGSGVAFPATQLPSTDANTLDDYAEGTWTPTVIGISTAGTATYAAQNGRYTKIGRLVFVECWVSWSGGTGSGDLAIAGLPFTVNASYGPYYPAATIARTNNLSWTAGSIPCANFNPGTTQIIFNQQPSGGGAFSAIPYDAAAYIMVSGSYTVA